MLATALGGTQTANASADWMLRSGLSGSDDGGVLSEHKQVGDTSPHEPTGRANDLLTVRQFDRDVARGAHHTGAPVGVDVALDRFQEQKEFFG
jgi:hypothetical protein